MGKFSAVARLATSISKGGKLTKLLKNDKIVKLTNAIKRGKAKQRLFLYKDFKIDNPKLDKFEVLEKINNFEAGCLVYGGISAMGLGLINNVETPKGAKYMDKALLAMGLGGIGFAIGGPIGAIIGNAIGLACDIKLFQNLQQYEENKKATKEANTIKDENLNVKA